MTDTEFKRKPIPKKMRQPIYKKYNGHCAYCGCEIEMKDMQVDHIVPVQPIIDGHRPWYTNFKDKLKSQKEKDIYDKIIETKDMNIPENLVPACRQCNFYKHDSPLETFRKNIEDTLWHKLEKDFNYKLLTKYGCITENRRPIIFYFEKMDILVNQSDTLERIEEINDLITEADLYNINYLEKED